MARQRNRSVLLALGRALVCVGLAVGLSAAGAWAQSVPEPLPPVENPSPPPSVAPASFLLPQPPGQAVPAASPDASAAGPQLAPPPGQPEAIAPPVPAPSPEPAKAEDADAKEEKKEEQKDAQKEEAKSEKSEYPTFKTTGFLQLDTGYYSQDQNNIATVGDAQDGTGFRRARLAVQGKVAEFTNYQIEVDFATAGRPSFFDNYLEQGNIPVLGTVRAGQYLQPFSVDAMSGFRNLPFLERSLPFLAFVPFRRVGIMASNSSDDELTNWAYSVFRTGGFNNAPSGDSRFATDFGDIGGYSFSTRATTAAVLRSARRRPLPLAHRRVV